MASYRLRAQIPAQALGATINTGDADIIVFSKPVAEDVEVAKAAKGHAKIVVAVCDPHNYPDILRYADAVTVASAALLELYPQAWVVPDPIEGDGNAPHADIDACSWIGHHSNLPELRKWLGMLPGLHVNVCTTPGKFEGAFPWSLPMQTYVYAQSGYVLLPASHRYKSANRLTQALHEGCFVVAGNIPAYADHKERAWVGDPTTGVRWVHAHRRMLNEIVAEAQEHVRAHYSAQAIGQRWQELFDSI